MTRGRPKGSGRATWPLIRHRGSTPGKPWMVDCGMIDGRRVRFAFETKEAAEGKAALCRIERKNEGTSANNLLNGERVDAEAALEILRPHGVSLKSAAQFYVQNIAIVTGSKTVVAVVDELLKLKAQDGRSPRYLKDLRLKLRVAFADEGGFSDRPIHEITAKELDDWLRSSDSWSAITRNNYGAALGVLFSFALKRGYTLKNPTGQLEAATIKLAKPGILFRRGIPRAVGSCAERFHSGHCSGTLCRTKAGGGTLAPGLASR
jgi:hypothetical protein